MRPIITVTAVVLLHLCVVAVLVGVNGCRSTSGFESEPDLATFSAGARPAVGSTTALAPVVDTRTRIPTPAPTKVAPIVKAGAGGKYTCVRGDTLVTVAAREKVSSSALAKANNRALNATLKAGQVLTIPAASPAKKAGTKSTGSTTSAPKAATTNATPAAPAPTFAPLKIISLTNPAGDAKPADTAPATK